ncbi:hypothetical protein VR7878_01595 [Vibrio ruber DSM 16370]|uniref:Uncharacterized protein n=1 Tax=Vibrio ruber (strain DSM 16370 / JCM 11486 / BCRC 17186 / CECT 7878 / LMG 23124 / VR1) TaxID=1123498 RepID=A0A1R4LI06_VIBR1|nr:hypothetical protein [Vibrio ruber]SJN56093.1 hypothetical protein VR7878_01595 [Vibrio ruber DSM 16370]
MKLTNLIIVFALAFSVFGCVSKITAPASGSTAKLTVEVPNFAEKQSILMNESVWFNIATPDESWGGQQVIKPDEPVHTFTIPADETLNYSIRLLQGGGGFDSVCALHLEMNPPENANLKLRFILERQRGDEKITGCVAELYLDGKPVESYRGGATITHYIVKFI